MNPIRYGILPPIYHVTDYGHDAMWDITTPNVYDQVWCNTFEELHYRIFRDVALEIIAELHINGP